MPAIVRVQVLDSLSVLQGENFPKTADIRSGENVLTVEDWQAFQADLTVDTCKIWLASRARFCDCEMDGLVLNHSILVDDVAYLGRQVEEARSAIGWC